MYESLATRSNWIGHVKLFYVWDMCNRHDARIDICKGSMKTAESSKQQSKRHFSSIQMKYDSEGSEQDQMKESDGCRKASARVDRLCTME